MPSQISQRTAKVAGATTIGFAGVALTLAALNRLIAHNAPEPQPALGVEPQLYAWSEGDISYSVAGHGPAVLLLHGIYAGASSFEFRQVFEKLAQHFRVFAPDLPGFGLSAKPKRTYTPETYISFIREFAHQVAGSADHPVHLIANSLSCAFAIEAAVTRADMFDRLVLIEPTGIDTLNQQPEAGQRFLGKLILSPLIGDTLYNLLVSRAGLRYYLMQQVYRRRDEVTDDMIDTYYAVSHQESARYAAASFISGELNLDIADAFEAMPQPVLLCWGRDARMTPLEGAEGFLERNQNAELIVFERSGGLPHDEEPEAFVEQVGAWLGTSLSSRRR